MGGKYPGADDILAVRDALVGLGGDTTAVSLADLQAHATTTAKSKMRSVLDRDEGRRAGARTARIQVQAVGGRDQRRLARAGRARVCRAQGGDRNKLEKMSAYAQSGACRWKMLLDYFSEGEGFERCGGVRQLPSAARAAVHAAGGRGSAPHRRHPLGRVTAQRSNVPSVHHHITTALASKPMAAT